MMKQFISIFICLFILSVPVMCFADEEPESTTQAEASTTQVEELTTQESDSESNEHLHSWDIVAFDAAYNVITLKCSECDTIQTINFTDCLTNFDSNSEYFSAVDVNNDGVINGRDYAYLVRGFTNILQTDSFVNMFSSKEFLYKEIFLYVYLTVLFIVSTGVICYTLRRSKK